MDVETDNKAKAEEFKLQANEAFKAHKYVQAVNLYTQAVELDDTNPIYFSNRSFAHLRLENFVPAVDDASRAIELDATFAKGYYRRGSAYLAQQKFTEGLKDFRKVAKIRPSDPDAQKKLKQCESEIKKIRFRDAISTPDAVIIPASESLDITNYAVPSSYQGPRLSGEEEKTVDLSFIKDMMEAFKNQKSIHTRYAFEILLQVKDILKALPSLNEIAIPEGSHFTVCGDVHGQFYDLCNIFELNGMPSASNPYLFNGDFVDRGSFSVEVIFTMFAFKAHDPSCIHFSRGNHESRNMNKFYGFEGEVKAKFNDTMAELFSEVFCYLPLASCLNKKVFVVHGGLFSEDNVKLEDIRNIDRNKEPPDEGLMCELLWSDPQGPPGRSPSKRGVGVAFGPDVTTNFLETNGLELVVRSHEVKEEGFEVDHDEKLVTVFSAPNYCDQMGNKGAFIRFEHDMVPHFTKFSAVPHPPVRPMRYANNLMNMMM